MTRVIIFIVLFLLVIFYFYNKKPSKVTSINNIANLTNLWVDNVIVKHDPDAIYNMFCKDGNLMGTVSQVKRKGLDIKKYFDYFAKLQGINVVDRKYNISKVTDDVYVNTAFITWTWDKLDNPITARMTFVFRDNCIFQLHSSVLPELNQSLVEISGSK